MAASRARAGAADQPRPARPGGRGGVRRAPRAGAVARRRAAAPHPARACSTRARWRRRAPTGAVRAARARWPRELGWDDARVQPSSTAGARWRAPRGSCRGARGARVAPRRRRERCGCADAARELELGTPLLMGIVNATPDSFSDAQGPKRARRAAPSGRAAGGGRRRDRSTWAASPAAPTARRCRRGGDRARGAAGRAARRPRAARCRWTPGAPGGRGPRSRPGAAMINDVSGLTDPRWPTRAPRPAPRLVVTHTRVARRRTRRIPALRRRGRRRARASSPSGWRGPARAAWRTSAIVLDPGSTWRRRRAESVEVLRRLDELRGARPAAAARALAQGLHRRDHRARARASGSAGTLAAVERGAARRRRRSCACTTWPRSRDFLDVRAALRGRGASARGELRLGRGAAARGALGVSAVHDRPDLGPALRLAALRARACSTGRSRRSTSSRPDVVVVSRRPHERRPARRSTSWRASTSTGSQCERMIVIPGNHDSRNVGYVHFEELFGERRSELHADGVSIVAVDSTEPDLDHGVIGRGRYSWIGERFDAHDGLAARVRAAPPPAAGARHRARAQRGPRRRRHARDASSAPTCTWCSPGTSTCRTPGGSRTCSS